MPIHYKIDLLNDREMANFVIKPGDVLMLDVPDGTGGYNRGEYQVSNVDIEDAGKHPENGEHLTRVTLSLE